MRVTIVYASIYGNTRQLATAMADALVADHDDVRLLTAGSPDLATLEGTVCYSSAPRRKSMAGNFRSATSSTRSRVMDRPSRPPRSTPGFAGTPGPPGPRPSISRRASGPPVAARR